MNFRKHLLLLGALMAVAMSVWLHSPTTTKAAPTDLSMSLTCLPASGLTVTFWWTPNSEASTQWIEIDRLIGGFDYAVSDGSAGLPITVGSYAAAVQPFSVYTVSISELVTETGIWLSSPTYYFETGSCGGPAAPSPCTTPLCGGEFAGIRGAPPSMFYLPSIYGIPYGGYGVPPVAGYNPAAPFGVYPGSPSYPAFPPTIVQYPSPVYYATGYAAYYGGCHPSYQGACIPLGAGDFDCKHGIGNGPNFVRGSIIVVGPDTYGLDTNGDGVACNAPPEVFYDVCSGHHNGWWGDHGDWHNDLNNDGWDDNDWDHHDWNNRDGWGHDHGCYSKHNDW